MPPASPSEHADAVLLRSVDYGESDRIVTLLSSRHGKLGLLARGARRSKKRFGAALEPFALLDAELSLGRGELGSLRGASVVRAFPRILKDLGRMSAAGSALTLVREVLPEREPEPAVFASVVRMLEELDREQARPDVLLIAFDVHIMALSGFAPRLAACGVCGKRPQSTQAAHFDAVRGFIVCQACGGAPHRLSGSVRALLLQALSDEWFAQTSTATCDPSDVAAAQSALSAFIEHRIERPITQSATSLGGKS